VLAGSDTSTPYPAGETAPRKQTGTPASWPAPPLANPPVIVPGPDSRGDPTCSGTPSTPGSGQPLVVSPTAAVAEEPAVRIRIDRTTGRPRKRSQNDDRRIEKATGSRVTIDGPRLKAGVRRPTSCGPRPGLDNLAAAPPRSKPAPNHTPIRAPATASADTVLREIARFICSPF
jgi:hypothetical protein